LQHSCNHNSDLYICNMVAFNRFFSRFSWDVVGFSASAICALHCLAVPFLLTISSLSGIEIFHNHALENVILLFSSTFGAVSIIPSYRKHHHKPLPVFGFIFGLSLLILGRFNVPLVWETFLTTGGAIILAASHYINWKLCRPFHLRVPS
jgi:hypothetical protein